ncbi:hypothetical protein B0H13DRAFT_1855901 [Mycena leptocephala]|nr:hypothetical protein B0H13DRAFT_1855901 [Mycena leptocephala]
MDLHNHHHVIEPDGTLPAPQYYYADPEHDYQYAAMAYPHSQMPPSQAQAPQSGRETRQLDLQQHLIQQQYHPNINFSSSQQYQSSQPHVPVSLSLSASPPSPSADLYDPSPPLSGSDTSADGIYHNSGASSPSSSPPNGLVQHGHFRYNRTPSPTSSSGSSRRHRRFRDSDDDEMNLLYPESLVQNRKEATRRQRIEAEQRRRDELRDGYAKLKNVLPVSNQKSSKVSLLDRATSHIAVLESENNALQDRVANLEVQMRRLQPTNEKFSGRSLELPSLGMYECPLPATVVATPQFQSLADVMPALPDDTTSPFSDGGFRA